MRFDDILRLVGEFGPYQRRVYLLACLIIVPNSWVLLIQVFSTGYSDHWCAVSWWNETACENLGYGINSCDTEAKKVINIPAVYQVNGSNCEHKYHNCARYNISSADGYSLIDDVINATTVPTCSQHQNMSRDIIACDAGWEHDRTQYTSTLVQELNLVCGDEKYIQYAQSFYYGGYLVGSALFGVMSDSFGRYPTLLIVVTLRIVAGFGLAFVHQYWAYALVRFFHGAANIASYILAFILATEFVGPSKRNVSGLLMTVPFAIGYMIFAGLAYAIRDWRMLQIAATTPMCLLLPIFLVLPESPRWLLIRGQTEKAKKIIMKMAEVNKVLLPDNVFCKDLLHDKDEDPGDARTSNATDLFRHPNLRKRTIVLMYTWMVCSMVYHGLNLSTSTLGVNVYLSFFLSAAVEIPAALVALFTIEWFGRKKVQCASLVLGGGACLVTIFIPLGGLRAAIAMIGKFGVTAGFNILYLFTAELYPTQIRSIGIGLCSTASRITGIVAPLILLTASYWKPLPLVVFGITTVLAGLFTMCLPETRGRELPETVADCENSRRSPKNQKRHGEKQTSSSISEARGMNVHGMKYENDTKV